MVSNSPRIRETRVFTYVIASADMWMSENNERCLCLRNDPEMGPVVRGEIDGMGPQHHANLSQVLLEYAMSCGACHDRDQVNEAVECTGHRLGSILARKLYQDTELPSPIDRICGAIEFILLSMDARFEATIAPDRITYQFPDCALTNTAHGAGLACGLVVARRAFIAICESMLGQLAPDWVMLHPTVDEASQPLTEITLQPRRLTRNQGRR